MKSAAFKSFDSFMAQPHMTKHIYTEGDMQLLWKNCETLIREAREKVDRLRLERDRYQKHIKETSVLSWEAIANIGVK